MHPKLGSDLKSFRFMWNTYSCLALFCMVCVMIGGYGEDLVYHANKARTRPTDLMYVSIDGAHFVLLFVTVVVSFKKLLRFWTFKRATRAASAD